MRLSPKTYHSSRIVSLQQDYTQIKLPQFKQHYCPLFSLIQGSFQFIKRGIYLFFIYFFAFLVSKLVGVFPPPISPQYLPLHISFCYILRCFRSSSSLWLHQLLSLLWAMQPTYSPINLSVPSDVINAFLGGVDPYLRPFAKILHSYFSQSQWTCFQKQKIRLEKSLGEE